MITLNTLHDGAYICGMVSVIEMDAESGEYTELYSGYNLIGMPEKLPKRPVRFMISENDTLIIEVYHS